ncbi:TPA: class C sortase, partial [Streptococcus suis]
MIKWLKKKGPSFIMPLIFILGIGLLAYPSVSDYWNSFHQSEAIMSYSDTVSDMTADQYKEIIDSARQYNQEKPLNWNVTASDIEAYNQELNFNKDGIMGYIEIPKIDVKLSIFHGTDETVLETSIGHLEGTSLPVGGLGTHSVLSGHRGLPSARLFSDLDKLREGDIFTVHVLNETLTYKVDQIRVVEPSDLSALTIEPQKDLLTLVTCTPYGINTHRLLVRGYRIENVNGNALVTSDAIQIKAIFIAPFIATPILFVIL